jgi:hypothetical protein
VNYWLIGLLITSNIALAFYVFRAANLARSLKSARSRIRKLKAPALAIASKRSNKKDYDQDMLALLASSPIGGLERYARTRLPRQYGIDNVLPAIDCDLSAMRAQKVSCVQFNAETPRTDMANHALRLQNWFVGKSELVYINALCIAYLRRRSIHAEHAQSLFMRLWREEGEFLSEAVSSRWMLSSLMTFMDHGETETQRLIGAVGTSFGNSVKIYEWEQTARGSFSDDFDLAEGLAKKVEGVSNIGRISIANADIFRNMLASYVDLALRDPVAGRVLITFLIRIHGANTIFSRLDNAKLAADPSPDADTGYSRHWSFGRHPYGPMPSADSGSHEPSGDESGAT